MMGVRAATTTPGAENPFDSLLALYIGGMGAREVNFHNDVFARMGYLHEANRRQACACGPARSIASSSASGSGGADVCIGAPGISRSDRRRFAASLLDAILGGSASSRLATMHAGPAPTSCVGSDQHRNSGARRRC